MEPVHLPTKAKESNNCVGKKENIQKNVIQHNTMNLESLRVSIHSKLLMHLI